MIAGLNVLQGYGQDEESAEPKYLALGEREIHEQALSHAGKFML